MRRFAALRHITFIPVIGGDGESSFHVVVEERLDPVVGAR